MFIAWFLLFVTAVSASPQDTRTDSVWSLISSEDDIKIYLQNNPPKDIVPLKAVMNLKFSMEEVLCVVMDSPAKKEWLPRLKEIKTLKTDNPYHRTEFIRIDLPWPIADRTFVVNVNGQISKNADIVTVLVKSTETFRDLDEAGSVRGLIYESSMRLTKKVDHVELQAIFYTDPKGIIPYWVVSFFTHKLSRRALIHFRKRISKQLYSSKDIDYIKVFLQSYHKHESWRQIPIWPQSIVNEIVLRQPASHQ